MTNSKNIRYIIFTVVVILGFLFFFNSRNLFGDDRKNMTSNYNVTIRSIGGEYNFKVANARIDKATKTMYLDFFIKGSEAETLKEYPPELYQITNGTAAGEKLKYTVEKNTEREYANTITIPNIPDKFYFIRLYIKSKCYPTPVPNTVDEFGNVMKHPDTPGKERNIWISIDYRSIAMYDSSKGEKAPTLEVVDLSKVEKDIESEPDRKPSTITTPSTSKAEVKPTNTTTSNFLYPGQPTTKSPVVTQASQVVTHSPGTTSPAAQTQPKVTTTTAAIRIHTISLTSDFQYNNVILKVNNTAKLTPVILPASATNKKLTWTSNKPDIASVDSNGIVTARSPGKAIITAATTDGSKLSASCMVTVK